MGWQVERRERTLRVDLDVAPITEPTERELVSDLAARIEREVGLDTLHLDGPGVRDPREGLVRLLRAAGQVARDHGLRYKVTRM